LEIAIHRKCDGIICGHIHTPEDKQVGEIHYLNSGDWVESLTAIAEHFDVRMELIEFETFMAERLSTALAKGTAISKSRLQRERSVPVARPAGRDF